MPDYGPLVWLLVMLLTFTIVIIALLLDPAIDPTSSSAEEPLECDDRLP